MQTADAFTWPPLTSPSPQRRSPCQQLQKGYVQLVDFILNQLIICTSLCPPECDYAQNGQVRFKSTGEQTQSCKNPILPSPPPFQSFSSSRAQERQRTLTWCRGRGRIFFLRGLLAFLEPVLQSQDLSANGKDIVFVQRLKLPYQDGHIPDLRKSKFRVIFCYRAT